MKSDPFSRIKGRYVVIAWLAPLFYLPGLDTIYYFIDPDTMWYWFDIIGYYYYQLINAAVLVSLIVYGKLNWRLMYQRFDQQELIPGIKLTVFVFIFSLAAAYALFYLLSYTHPEFVQEWFIDTPDIIYASDEGFPLIANSLSFLSLIVLAPVLEEFSFRGLLLHRWTQKWGMTKAILISSCLFALTHPDPLGAAAFGVAMCVLYLKSQTLWLPTLCHALTNLTVWLFEAYYYATRGSEYRYTLEEFQKEWYVGVTSAIIVSVWVYLYMKRPKSKRVWRLPEV